MKRPLSRASRGGRRNAGVVALGACMAFGCSTDQTLSPVEVGLVEQAVLGGFAAPQAIFDHTGALVALGRDGEVRPFCTAALIGAETVVTAKHCAKELPIFEQEGTSVEWRTGANAFAPSASARIVAVRTAPGDVGGYVGNGRDVAVLLLDHPLDLPIVEPVPLPDDAVGMSLLALGYGVFSPSSQRDGKRRVGHETVAATSGRANEALFGDFESYVEWSFRLQTSEADFLEARGHEAIVETWRIEYDTNLLLDGHEAIGGTAPNDRLACRGDSGGPLLRLRSDGSWVSHGVVSGGPSSARSECAYGSVYSTFGPITLDFLRGLRDWTDPCEDLVESGSCDGQVARRCQTSLTAEIRRPLSVDCAALGQACVVDADGAHCR